jgi:hypothetical protein
LRGLCETNASIRKLAPELGSGVSGEPMSMRSSGALETLRLLVEAGQELQAVKGGDSGQLHHARRAI